jgi:heme-degrading monooxygenase HmoA
VFARSTTIRARQESIDTGIAQVRDEVMPALLGMDGCIGLSMLVDRQGGRCIATSAWQSEEAMAASEEQLRPMRERVGEMLGGQPEVERWEIAMLHRDHTSNPGACVRATWVRVEPADLDDALEIYRTSVLPGVEGMDGFCSASMLVDRGSGRCVSSVTFDSMDALERSRQQAASMRDLATREARATVLDVCEFELALAHLRVPELA